MINKILKYLNQKCYITVYTGNIAGDTWMR